MIDHDSVVADNEIREMQDMLAMNLKGQTEGQVDPLKRLLDPEFTDVLWEYEDSWIGDDVPGNLHDSQQAAINADKKHRFLFWGNQCLAGEQEVYDPVAGSMRRVDGIRGLWHVLAWDGTQLVNAVAEEPFIRDVVDIWEVETGDGAVFRCSPGHRVLCEDGMYRAIADAVPSELTPSASLTTHGAGGQRSTRTTAGSLYDCLMGRRSRGGRPLAGSGAYPGVAPSQRGAQGLARSGEREGARASTASRSRLSRSYARLSSSDARSRSAAQYAVSASRASSPGIRPASASSPSSLRPDGVAGTAPRSTHAGSRLVRVSREGSTSVSSVARVTFVRRDAVYSFGVPRYKNYWASDTIHRNCGKTTLGAIESALVALKRHPQIRPKGPALVWASALTWELWENILLPELLTWLPKDRIISAPEPFKSSPGRRTILVRADDGTISRITAKSVQQGRGAYQSAKVHLVWFDEEHPEPIWDEVMLRLVRFGGRTLTTATPLMGLTWIYHRIYQDWKRGEMPDVWCSHAGLMDNPAIDPAEIEAVKRQFKADPSQLAARLYGKFARPAGLALASFDPNKNLETFSLEDAQHANKETLKGGPWTHVCGIDFGYWRFGFLHGMVDHAKRCHLVGEYFSQKQTLEARAKWIHAHLTEWGAPPDTRLWGDAANPTDINELNREFKRIGSPYRCRAVKGESKARVTGTALINNLFHRGALLIRRDIGEDYVWYRGMNASSDGQAMAGSRLLYEIGQWRYEKPKQDDKVQAQDPVDDTADGADLCAALRYMLMSHYRPPKRKDVPKKADTPNRDRGLERMREKLRAKHRVGGRVSGDAPKAFSGPNGASYPLAA